MLSSPLEVRPGLWQITLPLPFELSSVNVYLVRLHDGWMLMDTGLATSHSYAELTAQLAHIGVPLQSIRQILLTHTHPDHVGQAKRLLAETGAQLFMSADERDQLHRAAASSDQPEWLDNTLHRAGVPPVLIETIENSFVKMRPQFQPLVPDRILNDSEVMETAIGPLELHLTPGHSPGHMCLYNRDQRILFSGDHILQSITPNIGWLPGRDALAEFFASLERVRPIEAETILPGHGKPFSGHADWITATRGHHDDRCRKIVDSLDAGPRTAHQLVSDLWARPLAPFHHRFAVFEVLAHLEFLLRLDAISSVPQADGSLLWKV